MKKMNISRYVLYLGMVSLLAVSCKDGKYTPGDESNYLGVNVYFEETEPYRSLPLDEHEITFRLERDDAPRADENVPLHFSCAYPEAFDVPEYAFFPRGTMTSEVTIYFTDKIEDFKEYRLSLYVDEAYTQQYIQQTTYPRIDVKIVREDYEVLRTGRYTCGAAAMDLVDWGVDGTGASVISRTVELEYSRTLDAYRIDPWGHGKYIRFTVDEDNEEGGIAPLELDARIYVTGDMYYSTEDEADVEVLATVLGTPTFESRRRTYTFPFTYGYSGRDAGDYNDTFSY